ncbi:hypothetical protein M422DRAFT_178505 [Sphaerobolus stellatus SS14]|uniref:Unplaced genomic scaffold SPHSTscaffold_347, whole genome shotgun sequence n=1 Tax=Sphaerobolus stellatus (strain SS14) TaxID=990650 RepID=A0A0C9T8F2_SPHS4|nr:hypothetical protein M422DRAFT_193633 [Sphaerobolus stellatus SS14]KIJ37071.1 hypothetical protein M422DRAFT_178505 [Sphaerobolus stellatus SS14]
MSTPSKTSLLHLYGGLLRASRSFSSYNFRTYFISRTKRVWKEFQSNPSPERVSDFYKANLEELDILRRSAVVNSIYGGRKLVVESNQGVKRLRSDN